MPKLSQLPSKQIVFGGSAADPKTDFVSNFRPAPCSVGHLDYSPAIKLLKQDYATSSPIWVSGPLNHTEFTRWTDAADPADLAAETHGALILYLKDNLRLPK